MLRSHGEVIGLRAFQCSEIIRCIVYKQLYHFLTTMITADSMSYAGPMLSKDDSLLDICAVIRPSDS